MNEDDLKEFGTLSGYLCSQAGEIPAVGDYVVVGGYMFTVTKVGFTVDFFLCSAVPARCNMLTDTERFHPVLLMCNEQART